jgi:hypothetical protein
MHAATKRSYGTPGANFAVVHGLRCAPPVANVKRRYAAGNQPPDA